MAWHHTWSIHVVVSPAQFLNRTHSHQTDDDQRMEEDATSHIRRLQVRSKKGDSESDFDAMGDYVRMFWISTSNNHDSGEKNEGGESVLSKNSCEDGSESACKRSRCEDAGSSDYLECQPPESGAKHLHIEVRLQEKWSATVVCCYFDSKSGCFELCLARGLKSSYDSVFAWMAAENGCHVGVRPISLSSTNLAQVAAAWAQLEFINEGSEPKDASQITSKPLVLTFEMPPTVATAGLATLSLTVPPQSLLQLCKHMQENRNENRRAERANQQHDDALPVVRAMQCYIREAFRIDIQSFQLVKVAMSVATMECDGRFKPVTAAALPEIRSMVLRHKYKARMIDLVKADSGA